jgi:hypothetical protein
MSGFKDGGRVIVPGYLEEIISLASEWQNVTKQRFY